MASALVLGGAGFIGSNICRHLAVRGFRVIAVDGLMPRTSGNAANLASVAGDIELIVDRVEDVASFADLIRGRHGLDEPLGIFRGSGIRPGAQSLVAPRGDTSHADRAAATDCLSGVGSSIWPGSA